MDYFARRKFSFEQIPNMTGKVAIITGSNTGIGKVSALEMARKGCVVILACRNEEKTLEVVDQIKSETGNHKIEFIQLDLLRLSSVKEFVDKFLARYNQLDILMNNAGVMFCPFGLSEDSIETQFATNHVAHHYLTMLLLPLLEKSQSSRVINVSSIGHIMPFRRLNLESISDPKQYNKHIQYGKTKAANILFTRELSKRLEAKGIKNVSFISRVTILTNMHYQVFVNCNHPGFVSTDLYRHVSGIQGLILPIANLLFTSPEDGALTQLYLATSPEVEQNNIKGQYYVPFADHSKYYGVAASEDAPLELWEFTEALIKEKVPSYQGAII